MGWGRPGGLAPDAAQVERGAGDAGAQDDADDDAEDDAAVDAGHAREGSHRDTPLQPGDVLSLRRRLLTDDLPQLHRDAEGSGQHAEGNETVRLAGPRLADTLSSRGVSLDDEPLVEQRGDDEGEADRARGAEQPERRLDAREADGDAEAAHDEEAGDPPCGAVGVVAQ